MTRPKITPQLLLPLLLPGLLLALAPACGGQPRRVANDEVSTPMRADDEAALDEAPKEPSPDAGLADDEPGPPGH